VKPILSLIYFIYAESKNIHAVFGTGPMKDVYFDFRLPWPAKIAAGMLTPGKSRPFEIYITTTWTDPYFDHTYLGFLSIKSNDIFTKTYLKFIQNVAMWHKKNSWNLENPWIPIWDMAGCFRNFNKLNILGQKLKNMEQYLCFSNPCSLC
jgi:hypothetical protein